MYGGFSLVMISVILSSGALISFSIKEERVNLPVKFTPGTCLKKKSIHKYFAQPVSLIKIAQKKKKRFIGRGEL